jgi:heat shock protein HslJ
MKLVRLIVVFSSITFALSACTKEKVQQTIDNAKDAASDASDKAKQKAADAVNQVTQAVTEKVKQSASDATNQAIADAKEKAGKAAAEAATQTKEALSQAALAAKLQAQKAAADATNAASDAAVKVQSQTSTPAPHPSLERTDWQLTRLGGKAAIVNPDQTAPDLILNHDGHRVEGSSGCNRMSGTYHLDGQSLKFGALASTRMACPKGMDQEQSFLQALELVRTWKIKGNHLELSGESGDPVAVFEARNTK